MSSSTLSDRIARAFAVLRGVMLVLFSVVLLIAPERAMPGSSSEPAHSLAVMFASRTILLGLALAVLALRAKRKGLAWLLLADAALQLFDTGMALATHKGVLAVLPAMIGGLDAWAGVVLLRLGSADDAALATNRSGPP
jgi:hypothetical protein